MKFDNSQVRRRDRLLTEPEALCLLRRGEYACLSMTDTDGTPYGVPVSYVWDEQAGDVVYVHCAPEGQKLRALSRNNAVALCVVGRTQLLPERLTTAYESLIGRGHARLVSDEAERWHAVELILQKYAPGQGDKVRRMARSSMPRTAILRIDLFTLSGKCKPFPATGVRADARA